MKPCFGYIRVSTVRQGEGVSLQEQKDAIQVFASRQNLEVIEWFEEKQTAAKSGRPIFNRMLGQLRRGKASGLIMHKIDRSARNLKDWAIVSELPDQGIEVFIATESLDFSSRGGRLTADMLAVIASDFIRNLREETKKGIRGRLLIDGTLDDETYLAKKQEAKLKMLELNEELRNLPNPSEIEEHNAQFIELLKNLTGLYEMLNPADKRVFIENTFSNRIVIGENPCVTPYSWVREAQNGRGVFFGAPHPDTDRTFCAETEHRIGKIMDLFDRHISD